MVMNNVVDAMWRSNNDSTMMVMDNVDANSESSLEAGLACKIKINESTFEGELVYNDADKLSNANFAEGIRREIMEAELRREIIEAELCREIIEVELACKIKINESTSEHVEESIEVEQVLIPFETSVSLIDIHDDKSELLFSDGEPDILDNNIAPHQLKELLSNLKHVINTADASSTRRHLMSLFTTSFSRKQTQKLLDQTISKQEWSAARKHQLHPGPLYPVIKKHHLLNRLGTGVMDDFIEWLYAADLLQSLSYGHKVLKYSNGVHVAIESVKRKQKVREIVKLYSDT